MPDSILARLRLMRLARYILAAATGVIATGAVVVAAPAASADLIEPPSIESEAVSHITTNDAALEAQINPKGLKTTYRFRLESGCLWPRECAVIEVYPLPSGELPASNEVQSVSLDLNKAGVTLKPSTEYAYSVEATNAAKTAKGLEKRFKTLGTTPVIESETVSHLTSTDATLEATINDEGLEVNYGFHLLTAPMCLTASPPCERPQYLFSTAGGTLLASGVGQNISVDLNDAGITLSSGERYEYWVSTASSAGVTEGVHEVLVASMEPAVEPVKSTVTPGPVSNEPGIPLAVGSPTTASDSSPAAGDPIPTGIVSKPAHPAHGKPSTKHGKRRRHRGKHTGTHHTKKR